MNIIHDHNYIKETKRAKHNNERKLNDTVFDVCTKGMGVDVYIAHSLFPCNFSLLF